MYHLKEILLSINILFFIYTSNNTLLINYFSIIPHRIIEYNEYYRIFTNVITHGNIVHLLLNMISLSGLIDKLHIRKILLSYYIVGLIFIYGFVYVGLSLIFKFWFNYTKFYYTGSIGFSGIIFGLLHLYSSRTVSSYFIFLNYRIPMKYYSFFQLLFVHIIMPNTSFIGHISGIISSMLLLRFFSYFV